jgi:NhaP-type Na+/H+ or K+/H+ antiporter
MLRHPFAAVAAGITMSYGEQSGRASAVTRVRRTAVWDTVQFAMSGIIFVLLGEQLPQIASSAIAHRPADRPLSIRSGWSSISSPSTSRSGMLRFAWVWVSLRFTLYRAAQSGRSDQQVRAGVSSPPRPLPARVAPSPWPVSLPCRSP